jgi:hypothetical protein
MAVNRNLSSDKPVLSLLFLFLAVVLPVILPVFTPSVHAQSTPVEGTLQIIAVMAEFEPDDNRFTSGNGTFEPGSIPYLEDPGTPVDALPHNQAYFEAHLEFVKNYFERVSDSRLSVQYTVLPEVYRLPLKMEAYSPVGENPELHPVAELARDVWMTVAENGELPFPDIQQGNIPTAFVIFHAGIGRDVELTGTTLDRTPQDIPSVYLGTDAISELLDDPLFSGFPIDNGDVLVTNSLVVPRTLTRAGTDVTGARFLIPLSINGLLTAQIGSHLGLPDLFNTETGESGIGQFGLMDGAGIFAFNGLFPPELSAWEKLRLGWADAVRIDYTTEAPLNVPAAVLREENPFYKIAISSGEYFLVENRHRDPDGSGVSLTIRRPDGSEVVRTFTNRDTQFVNREPGFDRLLESGVVVDVSNFDFALPGGLDNSNPDLDSPVELNGGILIWHIDESIIREKESENAINNDLDRRGIKLMEADGAQDIGRRVAIGLTENPSNGSPYDFWWSGNNATVVTQSQSITLYQNRFGPDTTPDNSSNSGGASSFELFNFSDNLATASFEIREADPLPGLYSLADSRSDLSISVEIRNDDAYYNSYPLSIIPIQDNGEHRFLIPGTDGFRIYSAALSDYLGEIIPFSSLQQPLMLRNNQFLAAAGKPDNSLESIPLKIYNSTLNSTIPEDEATVSVNNGFISETDPGIIDLNGSPYRYNINSRQLLEDENGILIRSAVFGEYRAEISGQTLTLFFPGGSQAFSLNQTDMQERLHTGLIRAGADIVYFYLLTGNRLSLFVPDDAYRTERVLYRGEAFSRPAIADFDDDGFPDFLFTDRQRNMVTGLNINGSILEGFPIRPRNGMLIADTPLVADLTGDDTLNLIITGKDSYSSSLLAYNRDGKMTNGFPLTIGPSAGNETFTVHPAISGNYLAAVGESGDLKVWQFNNMGKVAWPSAYGTGTDNKSTGAIDELEFPELRFSLLNRDETYNWPNPAQDETILRVQTDGPAEITISVTSMSGRKVYSETVQSRGVLPEEYRIDTSDWASGAYFAMVTASRGSQTENKVVKIAIVR